MKKVAYRLSSLEDMIVLYWFLFWLTNGADKFFNDYNLLLFTWLGKDRIEQLGGYFNAINLPEEWVIPTLYTIGFWEIFISLFFLAACIFVLQNRKQNVWKIARYGFFLTALTFIGFSVFDVIVGDRFELLEHNAYIAMVILTWFIFVYRRDRAGQTPTLE